MNLSHTKTQIVRALDELSPESLAAVGESVEFLRAKIGKSLSSFRPPRTVKLGGLCVGYEDIRAARREVWASLGRGFGG